MLNYSVCACHIFVLVEFVKLLMVMGGGWLFTKKTFKKHQKKERESVEKINEIDTESESEKKSDSESISKLQCS